MSEVTPDLTTTKQGLDAFLVDNQELEQLDARLSAFNLFDVLRIGDAEIRHSNVLAWLLTPGESHGLGPIFLQRFLSRLLMDNDGSAISLSPAQVELMNFGDVEVLRESQNIDILATSHVNHWCLLIENKIYSTEGQGQLLRYYKSVKKGYPDLQIIPVYLTLEGDDLSEEAAEAGYLAMSHTQVLELADQIVTQNRSRIPDDVLVFLDHYLLTLRRLTMQDPEIADLCKAIYRKHGEAIEMVRKHGRASNVIDAILEAVESKIGCDPPRVREDTWVVFVPNTISEVIPDEEDTARKSPSRGVPIECWCGHEKMKENELWMGIWLGSMDDPGRRSRLFQAIKEAGFDLKPGKKSTKVKSYPQELKLDDDVNRSVNEAVAKLWETVSKDVEKLVHVLRQFDWS